MGPARLDMRLEDIADAMRGLLVPLSGLRTSFDSSVGWLEERLTSIERKADYTQLLLCRILKEISMKHTPDSDVNKTDVVPSNQVSPGWTPSGMGVRT